MKFSKEVNEKLREIYRTIHLLEKLTHEVNNLIEDETDGKLAVCDPHVANVQFYTYEKREETLELLNAISDNGVEESWDNERNTCYSFKIDNNPIVILLSK